MNATSHKDAYQGSHYTILGAGGDLAEWVAGYNKLLAEEGIGTPVCWAQTTGENINNYAATRGTVKGLLLDEGRNRIFRIYPLNFLCLCDAADNNGRNAVSAGGTQ